MFSIFYKSATRKRKENPMIIKIEIPFACVIISLTVCTIVLSLCVELEKMALTENDKGA